MMTQKTFAQTDPRYDSRYQSQPGAGKMGMALFLVIVGVLFVTGLIGYAVVRSRAPEWPPPGTPPLFYGLWFSTGLLVMSSVFLHMAYTGVRGDRQAQLKRGMFGATLLGAAFLISQMWCWLHMMGANVTASSNLFGFTFYMLTGLHALHVIGGVIQLVYTTARSWRGAYSSDFYPGVLYSTMYWHFLTAIWIVVFSLLVLGN